MRSAQPRERAHGTAPRPPRPKMAAAGKAAPLSSRDGDLGGGFLGARLPAAVGAMARSLRQLDRDIFRRLLAVTVSALEGNDCKDSVRRIAENADLSEQQLAVLISGMYTLLREALRLPLPTFKQEVFKEDLKDLRIPDDFIADFASVVFGNRRPVLETTTLKQANSLPRVKDFQWRVDVAISTSLPLGIFLYHLAAASAERYCFQLWCLSVPDLALAASVDRTSPELAGPCIAAVHFNAAEAFEWGSSSF
uniref:COMM domain containing 5 n=1 Tax=Crocodylus porosus TaxID=8502 RepID=A0A7M4EFE1_CROPO